MLRSIRIIFFVFITVSGFSQAQKNSVGIYCDKNGKPFVGISYEYYQDSVIHVSREIKNGKEDGLTQIYFDNGKLEEIRSFKNGLMHGKWIRWNKKEVKIAEAGYFENLKDGKWYVWDDNGTLRYDMTYDKGKKAGTWLMYDEKGNLTDKKTY